MTQADRNEPALTALQDDLLQLELLLKEAIAKLSVSFIGAHEALASQRALPDHDTPARMALTQAASAHLDEALTALQFEDIASQLIASARRHLGSNDERAACSVNRSVPQLHMDSGSIELF